MKTKLISLLIMIFLPGCVTQQQVDSLYENQRPPTKQEKAVVVDFIRNKFYDPYSLRDAEISYVSSTAGLGDSGYQLCVYLNGKNRVGGYIGKQIVSIDIDQGKVVYATPNVLFGCDRTRRTVIPFPEAENIGH